MTQSAKNERIPLSAIEWGAAEPAPKRTGQWQQILDAFAARPGESGLIPCDGYKKKYLSVLASDMRRGKGVAKSFALRFDARVVDDDGVLSLWIRYPADADSQITGSRRPAKKK